MKLNKMKLEELEVLSYTDLTEMILIENKKPMNTASIFKNICSLLQLSDEDYSNKIGDYYTSLTTDKRFILLDSSEWDLKDNHKAVIIMDEEDDDEYEEESDYEETNEDENTSDSESIEITDDEIDLDDDDEYEDLNIVDDDELDRDDI